MKLWLCFLLALFPLVVSAQSNGRSAPVDVSKMIGVPAGPRHAEVEIKTIIPKDGAIVSGGFHDFAPGDKIPRGDVMFNGYSMPALQARWKSLPNPVFIRGLGANLYDGAEWSGMLEPDGNYTYRSPLAGVKTMPAFKVSEVADPVAAFYAAAQGAAKSGLKGSPLDKMDRVR
jgi:hypothetical protein